MSSCPLEGRSRLWAQDAAGLCGTDLEVSHSADAGVLGSSGRHEPAFQGELCHLFILGTSALVSLIVTESLSKT